MSVNSLSELGKYENADSRMTEAFGTRLKLGHCSFNQPTSSKLYQCSMRWENSGDMAD